MAYETMDPPGSAETYRLVNSLHFQVETDGAAIVVDDRSLTASRLNKAAYIVAGALREPRTRHELAQMLAGAANSTVDAAAAAVASFLDELRARGWIEIRDNVIPLSSGQER